MSAEREQLAISRHVADKNRTVLRELAKGNAEAVGTDECAILAKALVRLHPDKAAQSRGNASLLGWFVEQMMKATDGKAKPKAVYDALIAAFNLPKDAE